MKFGNGKSTSIHKPNERNVAVKNRFERYMGTCRIVQPRLIARWYIILYERLATVSQNSVLNLSIIHKHQETQF